MEQVILEFEKRSVPPMPGQFYGPVKGNCGYTKTDPREWTSGEIAWITELRDKGYTIGEIAESIGRSETSISIKFKRIGKTREKYNKSHRDEKYEANMEFFHLVHPSTILDLYCGSYSPWDGLADTTTNDYDKTIQADYHLPADMLAARLYSEGKSYDMIDLDPYGSAFDCFDLCIRMAKKGIAVTFGEMGHKRWKRLDFVRSHYGITQLSDFTTERLIDEFIRIGSMHKKELQPVIVKEWPRISRVYFTIGTKKITEQWGK